MSTTPRSSFRAPRLTFLGTVRGEGGLALETGLVGAVRYEIDVYLERDIRVANGRITAGGPAIAEAFAAGAGVLTLTGGTEVPILLKIDPEDGESAEIELKAPVADFSLG